MSLESAGNGQPRDTKSRALLIAWLKKPERSAEELSGAFGEYIEADRVIASHPNASADLLEKLSHSTDKATRRRVVGNPNTPAEVYVYLGRQFPREFLANPALDLLLMINPGLMEEVPEALLIRLLKHADCPSSLLAWAAGHAQAKVQLVVLMNAKAPEQALEKLRTSKHISVRESVRLQTQLAGEADPEVAFEQAVRDRLAGLSMWELDKAWSAGDIGLAQWEALPLCFRLAKAITPSGISPEAIRRILMDTNWNLESILKTIPGYEDWYDVVYEKNLSAKLLFILAKLPFSWARESIAKNPLTPAAALEELARDSVYQVRLSVSGNPSAPMDTLLELAKESEEFLESVGKNPSTPLDFLAELASDPRTRIRASVAANTSAPTNLLELLSTDLNSAVRQSIAQNLSTPLSILAALAGDVTEEVFLQLARHPSAPLATQKELVMDLNKVYRCDLAKNPATSPAILKVLAKDTQSEVRANAAENPATPIADLRILAGDSNSWIRINVAKNPSTPARVLATLAKDLDEEVRWYVSRHQSTPESSLEVLATDSSQSVKGAVANNPKASGIALAKLANEADEQIRRNVAGNQSTPQDVLEALGHDPSTSVRLELAGNRVVPHGTLSQLAKDSDRQIRLRIAGNSSAPKDVLTQMAKSKSARICLELALNPNTPSTALIGLASNDSAIVLRTLARRLAHRCEKLRLLLQNHANPLVRFALIENLELDTNVLDKIAQRAESEQELEALLRHPNLSAHSAQELADKLLTLPPAASIWYQKQVAKASVDVALASQSGAVLRCFGKNPNKAVLAKRAVAPVMALCSGPFIEPNRIVRVAGSTDWLVRAAAARNPGTPENLIKKLSADANPLVAQLARSRMQVEEAASRPTQEDKRLDVSRIAKELIARIPKTHPKEHFEGIARLFIDDLWCELLDLKQVSWMVLFASLKRGPSSAKRIDEHLTCEHYSLICNAATSYERELGVLGQNVREWVASEPSSQPNLLKSLIRDSDAWVVFAAICNPAFPPEDREWALHRLLKLCGKQSSNILRHKSAPKDLLQVGAISQNQVVRTGIAGNPSTPVGLLEVLARDSVEGVREEVAKNPSTPVSVLDRLAKELEVWGRHLVAENPSTPVSALDRLAKDSEDVIRRAVAGNPSSPVSVLEVLAKDSEDVIRRAVAGNPSSPVSVLEVLAKDLEVWVRREVAKNPSIPVSALDRLAKDTEDVVRWAVAGNPSTSVSVLDRLAKDSEDEVRRAVAGNPSSPVSVLEVLAKDSEDVIRRAVAGNPSSPVSVLEVLAKDLEVWVRREVAKNPSTPVSVLDRLAKDSEDVIRQAVAENPSTPVSVLDRLAKDSEDVIRQAVAENPSTPVSVLEPMAKDSDDKVRLKIGKNPLTAGSVLETLSEDMSLEVRLEVAFNPNASKELTGRLFDWWRFRLQRSIKKDEELQKGIYCTEHASAVKPPDILRTLENLGLVIGLIDNKALTKAARSKDWLTRLAAALHPMATEGVLKLLRQDSDQDVALAARLDRYTI